MIKRVDLYYNVEWVISHHRYGLLMLLLVAFSFIPDRTIAIVLSFLFGVELILRTGLVRHKQKTNPYKSSLNMKLDLLFLVFDTLALLSLLATALDLQMLLGEEGNAARFFRALYLLRVLRMFRYIDIQSLMFSPGYGMFVSLVVMLSFFVQGTLLWGIVIFFGVEVIIRFVLLQNMQFSTRRDRLVEWGFWFADVVATMVMVPGLMTTPYANVLRAIRLVRLVRPWMVIVRNVGKVFREGDFGQEIVLVMLLLSVLSISGGVFAHYCMEGFDFSQDGVLSSTDENLFVQVWFSFRTLMAAGNLVQDPLGNDNLALFSILGVVMGMFILAFFIGIGSTIISGLMAKLRNEKLVIANHLVMIGWNGASPFIVEKLKMISDQRFSRLKLVFLSETRQHPVGLESWVTFRWGDTEEVASLQRVNLGSARQVLVCTDDSLKPAQELSQNLFSLMAIRQVNPNIPISYTVMGMVEPRLPSYRHMLQVGWDKVGFYNKPTVLMSEPDMRANLIRNVLLYQDVDQVLLRLMIPEREDESRMQVVDWSGNIIFHQQQCYCRDGGREVLLSEVMRRCFAQGVLLVAVADADMQVYPLNALSTDVAVVAVMGLAMDNATLYGEFDACFKQQIDPLEAVSVCCELSLKKRPAEVKILAIGWIGALGLVLKRLLDSYQRIQLILLDELSEDACDELLDYVLVRISDMEGAADRMTVDVRYWDFSDMEALRSHICWADKVIVSRPAGIIKKPHAMVASVLSHMFTLAEEESRKPAMFAIVDTRNQARMLQKELDRFTLQMDVNVLVPMEFYGTYVAHTSYLMYASTTPEVFDMHRALRYLLDSMMSDNSDEGVPLSLDVLPYRATEKVIESGDMYAALLAQGWIWLGFRIDAAIVDEVTAPGLLMRMFPRRYEFQCFRQLEIMINPMGNPQSMNVWENYQQHIIELIVIRKR
ncbi:MAG: hypothetical protein Q9M31_09760 [Mariprofundus sp.]|nr:hypothetical protein [Mariprofundus sp.]